MAPEEYLVTKDQLTRIADALRDQHGLTGEVDFDLFADVIYDLIDTSDADATAPDIAKGKTAYVNGRKITGIASGSSVETGTVILNFSAAMPPKMIYYTNAQGIAETKTSTTASYTLTVMLGSIISVYNIATQQWCTLTATNGTIENLGNGMYGINALPTPPILMVSVS